MTWKTIAITSGGCGSSDAGCVRPTGHGCQPAWGSPRETSTLSKPTSTEEATPPGNWPTRRPRSSTAIDQWLCTKRATLWFIWQSSKTFNKCVCLWIVTLKLWKAGYWHVIEFWITGKINLLGSIAKIWLAQPIVRVKIIKRAHFFRFHREDMLATLLSQFDTSSHVTGSHPTGIKCVPSYVAPDLASAIRRHISQAVRQRKGSFPCYYLCEWATYSMPSGKSNNN